MELSHPATAPVGAADAHDGVRVLRVVGPPQAPWPGILARVHDGPARYLVDAAALAQWPGWDMSNADHVLCIEDVVGRANGAWLAFPVCTEPVAGFLHRRRQLSAGEAVTLGVSIVRGLRQAQRALCEGVPARWWLTADSRPVLALAPAVLEPPVGTRRKRERPTRSLDLVDEPIALLRERGDAAGERIAQILTRFAAEPRAYAARADEAEHACFAVAAATALVMDDAGRSDPVAAAPIVGRGTPSDGMSLGVTAQEGDDTGLTAALRRVAVIAREAVQRWVPSAEDLRLGRVGTPVATPRAGGIRGAMQRRRRGPWILAAVIAAALAWGAFALMEEPGATSAADAAPGTAAAPSIAATEASASPSAPSRAQTAPAEEDPVAIAAALLDHRRDCAGNSSCLAGVVEDPSRAIPAGAVDLAPQDRTIELIDDFGGAAVVRVAPREGDSAQYVVLVRAASDDAATTQAPTTQWLLRDVYDAGQQPL